MNAALVKKIFVGTVVTLGLGGAGGVVGVVKLGEYTFVQHVARIARTSAVRDLGNGILEKFGAAQSAMKSQIKAQLAASRRPSPESEESDEP